MYEEFFPFEKKKKKLPFIKWLLSTSSINLYSLWNNPKSLVQVRFTNAKPEVKMLENKPKPRG